MNMEFSAADFQQFVGRTIERITDIPDVDEGFEVRFTDGSTLAFRFSAGEGDIVSEEAPPQQKLL